MAINSINTNIAAYYAQQNIGRASQSASSSISRLSSGDRIVRASDDVAALSVGTSLRTQVTTLKQALNNTSQGSSLLQVADGALSQVSEILQRQKAIAVQAGSGSLSPKERSFLDQEFQNLVQEIDRIAGKTNFNGVNLLDGSLNTGGSFVTTDPTAGNYVANFDSVTNNDAISALVDAANSDPITATAVIASITSGGTLNPGIIGNISNFAATFVSDVGGTASIVDFSFEINGHIFQANNVDLFANFDDGTAVGGSQAVVFNEVLPGGASGQTLTVTINDLDQGVIASQSDLDNFIGDYAEDALNGTYFSQRRGLTGFTSTSADGTVLQGISVAPVFNTHTQDTEAGDSFGNLESVSVVNVGNANDANGQITVRINGKDYVLYDLNTATGSDGILASANTLTLTRTIGETDRTETITIALTGLASSINVNTETGAKDLADALRTVLGGSNAGSSGGLSFQVGDNSADSLSVAFDGVTTDDLYSGATLDVLTAGNAATAADTIDLALDAVTSVRATVGALQSRFDFAAANIESSIQNQDAARAVLLDTDIASEATSYAQAQVQLQAGIAVLAQANQLPQNLLKLIG